MACRSMLRSGTLIEPILLRTFNFNPHKHHITSRTKCNNLTAIRSRRFHPPKPPLSCSLNQTPSSHHQEDPPPDTVFKAISGSNPQSTKPSHSVINVSSFSVTEVSKVEESVGQTTNVVIGTTVTDDSNKEWLALDEKVLFNCFLLDIVFN